MLSEDIAAVASIQVVAFSTMYHLSNLRNNSKFLKIHENCINIDLEDVKLYIYTIDFLIFFYLGIIILTSDYFNTQIPTPQALSIVFRASLTLQ